MTCAKCGQAVVETPDGGLGHAVNPGPDHHYIRLRRDIADPASRPAPAIPVPADKTSTGRSHGVASFGPRGSRTRTLTEPPADPDVAQPAERRKQSAEVAGSNPAVGVQAGGSFNPLAALRPGRSSVGEAIASLTAEVRSDRSAVPAVVPDLRPELVPPDGSGPQLALPLAL